MGCWGMGWGQGLVLGTGTGIMIGKGMRTVPGGEGGAVGRCGAETPPLPHPPASPPAPPAQPLMSANPGTILTTRYHTTKLPLHPRRRRALFYNYKKSEIIKHVQKRCFVII